MSLVYARTAPTDLRKGFNGLYALVRREHGREPAVGERFLFTNRSRSTCKVLECDGTGIRILSKRLSGRRFAALWMRERDGGVELTAVELDLYLAGCKEVGYMELVVPRAASNS